jgi:drug/metabolite transporter (DMT)-like permease
MQSRFLVGVLILMLANVGFSSKAVIIKLMYQYHIDTYSVVAMRMLFSLPVYVAVLIHLNRRPNNVRLTAHEMLIIGGLGILSYYVCSTLDFLGLQYISAGVERLILFTYPTVVLVASAVLFKKKITPPQYIALILTYVGVILSYVAERGLGTQKDLLLGASLVGLCAFIYAFFVIGAGEYVHKSGSVKFTCLAMIAATAPALLHSYVHNGMAIFNFPTEVYQLTFWLVLVATVIPTFMIVEGIRLVGASNSAIIGFVGPVSTIILGYYLLGEQVTWLQLFGTAIVLAGVFLVSWKGKSAESK